MNSDITRASQKGARSYSRSRVFITFTMRTVAFAFACAMASGCGAGTREGSPSASDDDADPDPADVDAVADNEADEGSGDVLTGAAITVANIGLAKEGDTVTGDDGIAAIVPAFGGAVTATAELEDGSSRTLTIVNDERGVHIVVAPESNELEAAAAAASSSAQAASTAPSACADKAFNLMGQHWASTFSWRFRSGTTPGTNSKSTVEAALKRAAANVSESQNDCGVARSNAPKHSYLGRTKLHTQVIGTATTYKCGQGDGTNVVGFGVLPHGIVGLACVWWGANHEAIEADVKLNDRRYSWFAGGSVPGSCHAAISVEGVSTHEFGHVFGLAHVGEAKHGNLTMSPVTRACSVRDASLGRGDVLGLRALYGP